MYQKLCENIILPIADLVTRQRVMGLYKFYRLSQWWDRDRLQEYQNRKIRETIRIAYQEVPLYKKIYDERGVNIADIRSSSDLALVPVITKDILKRSYPKYCIRRTKWPSQEFFTSGSSGKPFAVLVDNMSLSHARALMFLRANFAGWEIGEPILQTGMTLKRGFIKKIKDILLRVEYVSAFDLSDSALDGYLELIEKKRLAFIMGYPGSLYFLALRASEVGFNLEMKGIISWGDNLYEHYRQKIEEQFRCRVTDTYGCGEGIQVAAQCGMNKGAYHIFMPHVALEIVDDEGYPVENGEIGNILLTRLDTGAMPLIRYKVGDIGKKHISDSCTCGRGLELLASIDGRDTDVIITPNGNRLIVHFFTGIFEYYSSIDTFRVVQEKPDEILIEIVPASDFRRVICEKIKEEIHSKGGPDLKINFELVKEIPVGISNKRRFVVSRLLGSR